MSVISGQCTGLKRKDGDLTREIKMRKRLTQLGEEVLQKFVLMSRVSKIEPGARRHSHFNLFPLERDTAFFPRTGGRGSVGLLGVSQRLDAGVLGGVDCDLIGEGDSGPGVGLEDGHRHVRVTNLFVDVVGDGAVIRAVHAVKRNGVSFAGRTGSIPELKLRNPPETRHD